MPNFAIDQTDFVQDKTQYLSPRIQIVPFESSVLKDQEMCCICFGVFSEDTEEECHACTGGGPRILQCGHVFGRDCIHEAIELFGGRCPLCQTEFRVRGAGKFLSQEWLEGILQEETVSCSDSVSNFGRICFMLILTPICNAVELTMGVALRDPIHGPLWKIGSYVLFNFLFQAYFVPWILLFIGPFFLTCWMVEKIWIIVEVIPWYIERISDGVFHVLAGPDSCPIMGFLSPPG